MTPVHSTEFLVGPSRIRLQKSGESGKNVLFLHGAGGAPPWNSFYEGIGRDSRLFVPDHPGFGGSEDADWLRDVPDYAMFYLDFLDQMDLRDVHVVGHSLGGWIAAELAVRNSSRIKTLSLISPAGIRVKGVPMGDTFIWSPEESVRNLFHDQKLAEEILARPMGPEQLDVVLKNRFAFAKLAWQPRGFNPALEKWLHRIHLPTTIIWGRDDKVLPAVYAKRWNELIPHADHSVIDDCGHLPLVERPVETAALVNSHINKVAA